MTPSSKEYFEVLEAKIKESDLPYKLIRLAEAVDRAINDAKKEIKPVDLQTLILKRYKELIESVD